MTFAVGYFAFGIAHRLSPTSAKYRHANYHLQSDILPSTSRTGYRFNAFISWVREAISVKETLIQEVNDTGLRTWCKKQGVEFPKEPDGEEVDERFLHSAAKSAQK